MKKYYVLLVALLAQTGTTGDNSVLSLATNAFIEDLGASLSEIQLANIIYSLTTASFMIFGGMLGLVIGWKNNFLIGAALCVIGEAVLAISNDILTIAWVARVLIGVGASLLIPSVIGIITAMYRGKDRGFAFGSLGATTGVASIIMPLLAGIAIVFIGWRVAFLLMALYFLIVFILAVVFIPSIPKPKVKIHLDLIGTMVAAFSLLVLIVGISKISVWGFIKPLYPPFTIFGISPAIPLSIVGVMGLLLLIFVERRVEAKHNSSLIPSSYLKTRQVRNGLYLTSFFFLCFGATFFIIVSWMQIVGGFNGIKTAVCLVFSALPMTVLSIWIPRKMPNASPHKTCFFGVLLVGVSVPIMMLGLAIDGINNMMFVGLFLFGFGQGMVASQYIMIIVQAVNPRDAEQSGGIQASVRNVGQAIGIAIIGASMIFSSTLFFKRDIKNLEIEPSTRIFLDKTLAFSFVSNEDFTKRIRSKTHEGEEKIKAMLDIYKKTRLESAEVAMLVLLFLVLIHLFGMGGIPRKSFYTKD